MKSALVRRIVSKFEEMERADPNISQCSLPAKANECSVPKPAN